MPTIYDNIEEILANDLRDTLKESYRSDFCVGYFNLRGWKTVSDLVEAFSRQDFSVLPSLSSNSKLNELSEDQLKGYQWIQSRREASTREYSAHFDIGYKTAQRHLSKMKELGLLGDNGEAVNSPNFKYVVLED